MKRIIRQEVAYVGGWQKCFISLIGFNLEIKNFQKKKQYMWKRSFWENNRDIAPQEFFNKKNVAEIRWWK